MPLSRSLVSFRISIHTVFAFHTRWWNDTSYFLIAFHFAVASHTHTRIAFNYIRSLANCYFKCTFRLRQRFAPLVSYKWSISPPFFVYSCMDPTCFLWIKIAHSPPINAGFNGPTFFWSNRIDFVIEKVRIGLWTLNPNYDYIVVWASTIWHFRSFFFFSLVSAHFHYIRLQFSFQFSLLSMWITASRFNISV